MRIKIEERHIKDGQRCDEHNCPIALALMELFNQPVHVNNDEIRIGHEKRNEQGFLVYNEFEKVYETPREADRWMQKFDAREEVEPFEFELKEPDFGY